MFRAKIHFNNLCRSNRSAKNPAIGVENTLGTIAAKVTIPTQSEPSVISKASQPLAMINAQAADAEKVVAIHRFR